MPIRTVIGRSPKRSPNREPTDDRRRWNPRPAKSRRPPIVRHSIPLVLATTAWNGRVTAGAVAAWHLVAGVSTVWLVLRLARQLNLGRAAPLAALLVACDPILLNQSTLVMTETLAALLAAAVLVRHRPFGPRRIVSGRRVRGIFAGPRGAVPSDFPATRPLHRHRELPVVLRRLAQTLGRRAWRCCS